MKIILTDRQTSLTFLVTDDSGRRTREYVALVFPVNDALWRFSSSYVRTLVPADSPIPSEPRVASDGSGAAPSTTSPSVSTESLAGLPPNDYYVVAVDDVSVEQTRDPDTLAALARRATRVTLAEGVRIEVPLRRVTFADAVR